MSRTPGTYKTYSINLQKKQQNEKVKYKNLITAKE